MNRSPVFATTATSAPDFTARAPVTKDSPMLSTLPPDHRNSLTTEEPKDIGSLEPKPSQAVKIDFLNSPVNGSNASDHNNVHNYGQGPHSTGSPEPNFVHDHGQGQHISSGSLQHKFVHDHGCKCRLCIKMVNEVTNVSKPYRLNNRLDIAKYYETKVQIIQHTPEVIDVQKTYFVQKLFHEERPTVVSKSRVVMVDVEETVTVPVIKEVKKLKKIKVHKIYEEQRIHTYKVPVIKYERQCTMVKIPQVFMVEEDEEIKVPVIKEVPEKVMVQVPTGQWIENQIEAYKAPGDADTIISNGLYLGDHFSVRSSDSYLSDSESDKEGSKKANLTGDMEVKKKTKESDDKKEQPSIYGSAKQPANDLYLPSFHLKVQEKAPGDLKVRDNENLPAGEYVPLGKVEAVLAKPDVDNVMLHRDPFHGYCVALIVANQAAVEGWAKVAGFDIAHLYSKSETCKEVLAPETCKVVKKGQLEGFEIPTEVKLLTHPGDLVSSAMTLTHQTTVNNRAEDSYQQVQVKASGDVMVLDKVLDIVNLQAGEYTTVETGCESTDLEEKSLDWSFWFGHLDSDTPNLNKGVLSRLTRWIPT